MRQRGGRRVFNIFHEPQDAPDWSRDGTLLTFPVPVHFSASGSICMDMLHVPKKPSMQQEQQPSPRYQSVVYLAIAHPFSPAFTLTAGCINQGLDWEEVVPAVQNENKGCPPASRSRQTTERHRRSRHSSHSSLCPLRSPVLVPARPHGLKGKSSCLHRGCFVCFCQRERRRQPDVPWDTRSFLGSLCKVDQFICEFYGLKCIYDKLYIVNLFMVQTNLKRINE